jgi:hypothetical protein
MPGAILVSWEFSDGFYVVCEVNIHGRVVVGQQEDLEIRLVRRVNQISGLGLMSDTFPRLFLSFNLLDNPMSCRGLVFLEFEH